MRHKPFMARRWWACLAGALGLLISMGSAWADVPASMPMAHGEAPLQGLGGPLDLTDQKGRPFSLKQLQGQTVLVFFGFTQCGNTCPLAMAQARQLLAAFQSRKPPAVVFVTLDPLSDGPQALSAYLSHFDARIIGLTGTPPQIEQAARRYGVATQSAPQGSAQRLEHSSRWYLLDGNLKLSRVYKISTPVADIAQDIVQAQTSMAHPIWNREQP
jgi:protein SCO1/2